MTHALLRCMLRDEMMVMVVGSDEMGCGESNWYLVFKIYSKSAHRVMLHV